MATTGISVTDTATPLLADVERSMVEVTKSGALKAADRVRGVIDKEVRSTYQSRGLLARSFEATLIQATSGKVTSAALSDSSYAGIQNRGGTIRPRNRKNLAIPLRQHDRNNYVWPRNHPDRERFVFIKSKRGNKLLALVSGKTIDPVYLLKPQVTIRGTRYLDRAKKKSEPIVKKVFGDEVKLGVVEAGKRAE